MIDDMIENKKHYSLCQVIVSKNVAKGTTFVSLLRMADFLGSNGSPQLTRTRRFYKDPKKWDDPKNYVLSTSPQYLENEGEVGIWEWEPSLTNESKQYSNPVGGEVYEEISLVKLTRNSSAYSPELMDSLFRGVPYDKPLTFPLLLTISQKEDMNLCLEIGKEAVLFEQGLFRLKEGAKAKLYSLPTSDFVTTADCYARCDEWQVRNVPLIGRSFYLNYPIRGTLIAEVTLYPFAHYISEYLKYIGSSSPHETSDIVTLRRIFSPEADCITSFRQFISEFAEGDSTQVFSTYIQKFTQSNKLLDIYFDGKKKESEFLTNLIENTPDLKKKYCAELVENYLDEVKKEAEAAISDLTEKVQELEKDKQTLSEDVQNYKNERDRLSLEKEDLEQKNMQLSDASTALQTSISENTAALFKDLGAMRDVLSLVAPSVESATTGQKISWRPYSHLRAASVESLANISDAVDILVKNLRNQGFTQHNPDNLAKIILGSHLLRLPLLCFGYSAQKLINTLSITLSAELPTTICISTGFSDYSSLLSAVQSSPSSYVILENLVGFSEEYCYTHLSEDAKDKHCVFTVPYKDVLKLLPKEMYAHFIIVDSDKYYDGLMNASDIVAGIVLFQIPTYCFNEETRVKKAKELRSYVESYNFPVSYQYSRLPLLTLMGETSVDSLLETELETLREISDGL